MKHLAKYRSMRPGVQIAHEVMEADLPDSDQWFITGVGTQDWMHHGAQHLQPKRGTSLLILGRTEQNKVFFAVARRLLSYILFWLFILVVCCSEYVGSSVSG